MTTYISDNPFRRIADIIFSTDHSRDCHFISHNMRVWVWLILILALGLGITRRENFKYTYKMMILLQSEIKHDMNSSLQNNRIILQISATMQRNDEITMKLKYNAGLDSLHKMTVLLPYDISSIVAEKQLR